MSAEKNSPVAIERLLSEDKTSWDSELESETNLRTSRVSKLRPLCFDDYPGQEVAKENLRTYVSAAKKRNSVLDHVLLHGAAGLGKTTLANIVAAELGAPFYNSSGPSIERPADLAGILANLEPNSVLFLDEIHRIPIQVEEILYPAMEDFAIDLLVGSGTTARSVRMDLSPFTLVGATTRLSNLSSPFLSRFGIQERLEFYSQDALVTILLRSAKILDIPLERSGALKIAASCRGTPRLANRLLKRTWDFALVAEQSSVDAVSVCEALRRLEVDSSGLDKLDRRVLDVILNSYGGGPVGLEALAVVVGEDKTTLEEVYEPFLIYQGFIIRSPRGRCITEKGRLHLSRFNI